MSWYASPSTPPTGTVSRCAAGGWRTCGRGAVDYGGGDSAVDLRRDRISPEMRRRIAGHPDPAIRDARGDFVRQLVDIETRIGIVGLEAGVPARPRVLPRPARGGMTSAGRRPGPQGPPHRGPPPGHTTGGTGATRTRPRRRVPIRPPLVEHPNPRHTPRSFVDEPDPHVRYVTLRDPELPAPARARLAAALESSPDVAHAAVAVAPRPSGTFRVHARGMGSWIPT